MTNKNDDLLKRLLVTFRIEADDHLKAMTSGLLALEKTPSGVQASGIIETVFREVHSLKGAARAVNLEPIESLCQALESVFSGLKNSRLQVSTPLLDLLHHSIDGLGTLLGSDTSGAHLIPPAISALIDQLGQAANDNPASAVFSQTSPLPPAGEVSDDSATVSPVFASADTAAATVRISTAKLDVVMRQAEELLSPRLAARQRALELRDAANSLAAWKESRLKIQPMLRRIERSAARAGNTGVSTHKRKEFLKVLEYMESENLFLATLGDRLTRLNKAAARDQRTLAVMADSLLADVKEMQLLPCSSLLELMPRIVRDIAREQGKEVELLLHGGEIELDRRMLEEMKDPLIHLLRNAIDHGIETPAVRTAAGKTAHGKSRSASRSRMAEKSGCWLPMTVQASMPDG